MRKKLKNEKSKDLENMREIQKQKRPEKAWKLSPHELIMLMVFEKMIKSGGIQEKIALLVMLGSNP